MVPLFGAAYAAPNKGTTILNWFRSPKTLLMNPPVNGKYQGLLEAFECFSSTFRSKFYFQGLFKTILYSSTFQACANPEHFFAKICHWSREYRKLTYTGLFTEMVKTGLVSWGCCLHLLKIRAVRMYNDMSNRISHPYQLDESISDLRDVG